MHKEKKFLLLTIGLPGAGKSTASEVAKKLGFRVFSFGDIIREEVRRKKLAQNRKNTEKVANWFHSGREYLLAARLEQKLRTVKTNKSFYIVEGSRSPKQLTALKKHFQVKILAIVLPAQIRWRRQLSRRRSDIRTLADAQMRDKREFSYGIKTLFKKADWKISSNCSKNQFKQRCSRFLTELKHF